MRVGVVVLGDIGRSPRMCYHALSLAEAGFQVDLVGYAGSSPPVQLLSNSSIRIKHMKKPPSLLFLPKIVQYFIKAILQSLYLLTSLSLVSKLNFKLIIDFHNYSHTILAMSSGESSPIVKLTGFVEKIFGQTAEAAFCVTQFRPPAKFRPISIAEKHELLMRLGVTYPELRGGTDKSTQFTEEIEGEVTLRNYRPGLLVSSTSWTQDEDFSILLSALQEYEASDDGDKLPRLICIITGKGELKEYYMKKISDLNLKKIKVLTPWLEAEDYPLLLASADIGVSLHSSSSGLDLPMKVVDMFGCGLPTAALKFKAIGELVKDGENGELFENSSGLSSILVDWFKGFPENSSPKHDKYRSELEKFRELSWDVNWRRNAIPVIRSLEIQSSSILPSLIFFLFLTLILISYFPAVN
ncbi:chitobiosyldiphosphodolichol beta-mannosyltransferase [Eurytemora carolleeae]|uniref:chitobiosyldiphosphodolichol beta-mannosyltransferase n=1 Tax=Eurytemora carolleeae TaxID=1294199 RepID=UPI000C7638EA|nr:chitobiosyldiphosphodolichol beta-mannosyltransferase [Eurytemora carolleeae]|eukprot:XP_023328715.1 chitobiosyldiphosphodolichol beta-mannosyltransferase-like [Eurytemora affinis]